MDIVSHVLIGGALAVPVANSAQEVGIITLFSVLPDLFQIPLYLRIGSLYHRSFWISHSYDWKGFRKAHPLWSELWEIPHSLLFLVFIVVPLVMIFDLPLMAMAVYFLHIFVDGFTHRGEWALKPLYPFSYKERGFTNAWAWGGRRMVISWIVLGVTIVFLKLFFS